MHKVSSIGEITAKYNSAIDLLLEAGADHNYRMMEERRPYTILICLLI
ncbi:hypothetical protein [Wolbachia endosymbiont of Mansonella ozzardi]|nr:hypothetical protein [Wolbachia endosymbiont of Mansonella ozzardi]